MYNPTFRTSFCSIYTDNKSFKEEKVTYGGIEQRWVLVESADRKKADLNKLTQKIPEEALKIGKQLVNS